MRSASVTQLSCMAVQASLLPHSSGVFPFQGSGKLQRSQVDSSGTVGPYAGTRFDASTIFSQYSSVITGGVNPHSNSVSRAAIRGLPCGCTTFSSSSTTFARPSSEDTALRPASVGEYDIISSCVMPCQIGSITLSRPVISRSASPSSSYWGHSLVKKAVLRMTTPNRDCFKPLSRERRMLSPSFSENSSYQTATFSFVSASASCRTKEFLSSDAWQMNISYNITYSLRGLAANARIIGTGTYLRTMSRSIMGDCHRVYLIIHCQIQNRRSNVHQNLDSVFDLIRIYF